MDRAFWGPDLRKSEEMYPAVKDAGNRAEWGKWILGREEVWRIKAWRLIQVGVLEGEALFLLGASGKLLGWW